MPGAAAAPRTGSVRAPDGTPLKEVVGGVERFKDSNLIDRLPLVHPSKTPPEFGTVSRGTSRWLDFNGVALRLRDDTGLAPPLFTDGVNGTYNALVGVPPGKDGQVVVEGSTKDAQFVKNAGFFDPGFGWAEAGGQGSRAVLEVRSFEAAYVHGLWHLDFHHGSRKVLSRTGAWARPLLLGVLDDRSRDALLERFRPECKAEGAKVKELGGLCVVGTERRLSSHNNSCYPRQRPTPP